MDGNIISFFPDVRKTVKGFSDFLAHACAKTTSYILKDACLVVLCSCPHKNPYTPFEPTSELGIVN